MRGYHHFWHPGERNGYFGTLTMTKVKPLSNLQRKLVNEPLIRQLAVRHIAQHSTTPGIDNVRWTTGAEKYRAAMALESDTFMASPMKQVIILDKRNHKERHMGLPIFFDRAMHVLHGYALSPVAEVIDDRYSFGFRKGRSTMDLHACIIGLLEAKNAPDFVFYGDVSDTLGGHIANQTTATCGKQKSLH